MHVRKCGTYAGYQVHLKLKEKACRRCKDAQTAYHRQWDVTGDYRMQKRARERAQRRVAQDHPEEFSRYMAEEMAAERLRRGAVLLEA
jgi:hypothetical protein